MRISDWSSDVCSSDLGGIVGGEAGSGECCTRALRLAEKDDLTRQIPLTTHRRARAVEHTVGFGPRDHVRVRSRRAQALIVAGDHCDRSDERRVGTEGVSPCRSRGWPAHYKNNKNTK